MNEFIEKLIGRLEEVGKLEISMHGGRCNGKTLALGYAKGIENAIEIVNQLEEEYNNDFCEWFKFDYRTIAPKYHDAENPYWRIPENLDKLKYCPYCGKKIKIAPYQPKGE